jgi:hypothetical protein
MIRSPHCLALALPLLLALALPAHAAKPAKRAETAAVMKTLGTWKVKCVALSAGRRCTLARGYLPAILEIDEKGVRIVELDAAPRCRQTWRYIVDGRDLAASAPAERPKLLLAGSELTRERPMGRVCKLRRERVNIAGIVSANRLFLETWQRLRAPAAPRA